MDDFRDKRVTVAGLGRFGGGVAAAQWLRQQGARVLVTDQASPEQLADSVRQLDGYPVRFRLGEHRVEDFVCCDLVVASPAIPPSSKYLLAARAASVPITTEIRLFVERCPLPIIAVSGTKGKSTTCKLLELMLQTRYRVWLGGNIGRSLLLDLPSMRSGELVLLELSSFMLDYLDAIRFAPKLSLLTMLGSDHLEWHKTQDAYLSAKAHLLRHQSEDDVAVLQEGCPIAQRLAKLTRAKQITYGIDGRRRFELKIPGEHNQLNAQAAFAAAESLGIAWEQAQGAVRDFPGLPHRLQLVHEWGGIRFFDDSIATIPQAAAAALLAFPARRVIQIIGGHDKGLDFSPMCQAVCQHARAALCIGETATKLAEMLQGSGASVQNAVTLDRAMEEARKLAQAGDVVLLSPGCSSYDQFSHFQQRGRRFAELARALFV